VTQSIARTCLRQPRLVIINTQCKHARRAEGWQSGFQPHTPSTRRSDCWTCVTVRPMSPNDGRASVAVLCFLCRRYGLRPFWIQSVTTVPLVVGLQSISRVSTGSTEHMCALYSSSEEGSREVRRDCWWCSMFDDDRERPRRPPNRQARRRLPQCMCARQCDIVSLAGLRLRHRLIIDQRPALFVNSARGHRGSVMTTAIWRSDGLRERPGRRCRLLARRSAACVRASILFVCVSAAVH